MAVVAPGCVPRVELHECVPHHVQDREEVLPNFRQRAVSARTISADILVGSDKILGSYSVKTCQIM